MLHGIDLFVVISGSVSILSTLPLGYLAYRGHCDARELRRIQAELAEIQREIRHEQQVAVVGLEGPVVEGLLVVGVRARVEQGTGQHLPLRVRRLVADPALAVPERAGEGGEDGALPCQR